MESRLFAGITLKVDYGSKIVGGSTVSCFYFLFRFGLTVDEMRILLKFVGLLIHTFNCTVYLFECKVPLIIVVDIVCTTGSTLVLSNFKPSVSLSHRIH